MSLDKTTGLSQKERAVIASCCSLYPGVEQVLLYGSRAKGNWSERSDVDLAVKGPSLDRHELARLMLDLDDSDLPYPVDLLHYDTLNNAKLLDHIDRVGIVLFER